MEAGNHKQGVIFFDDEKQRVGKTAQESAAHVLEDDLELLGILAHALDDGVNRGRKRRPSPGTSRSYQILRLDQFRAGGLGEDNRII
jgi:hypothetical protein